MRHKAARAALEQTAADPKAGMTLAELSEFVTACYRHGIPDTARPTFTANWHSGIKAAKAMTPEPTEADG